MDSLEKADVYIILDHRNNRYYFYVLDPNNLSWQISIVLQVNNANYCFIAQNLGNKAKPRSTRVLSSLKVPWVRG